jgi:hypothetical protein
MSVLLILMLCYLRRRQFWLSNLFVCFCILAPTTSFVNWFSNPITLRVSKEGNSRNMSCTLNYISMFYNVVISNNNALAS